MDLDCNSDDVDAADGADGSFERTQDERNKFRRRPNFTGEEVQVLLAGYEKRKRIILSKLSPTLTTAMKRHAWELIVKEVNAVGTSNRTTPEVRRKMKDIKVTYKKSKGKDGRLSRISNGIETPTESTSQDDDGNSFFFGEVLTEPQSYDLVDEESETQATAAAPAPTAPTITERTTEIELASLGVLKNIAADVKRGADAVEAIYKLMCKQGIGELASKLIGNCKDHNPLSNNKRKAQDGLLLSSASTSTSAGNSSGSISGHGLTTHDDSVLNQISRSGEYLDLLKESSERDGKFQESLLALLQKAFDK